ncbi:unnamed protein product [Blepharisma stoltei]|uniref:K Homology domain-containing protein n=1 Tax=Blepharisma stoltei TaxID=1481888 RepID=A0AAU9JL14_9CILI|nr:unnamed protein product [Blepharisma stoltei]
MDSRENGMRRGRSRSRSPSPMNSPSADLSLMLLIPESLVSHFINPEVTNHIKEESKIDKICIFEPDGVTREKIIALYSVDLSKQLQAFHLIINDFLAIGDYKMKEDGIIILIPENMVSLLIGKGGKQVKYLQEKSNTNISVYDKKSLASDRQVKIVGRPMEIETAAKAIYQLIRDRNFSPESKPAPSPGRSQVRFVVPSTCAGILIGKGGLFTKRIKSEFDVDIRLIKGDRRPLRDDEHTAILTGSQSGVSQAIPKIIQKIDEAMVNDGFNDPSVKMLVTPSQKLRLLSSGSAALKEIEYRSRCGKIRVLIDKRADRDDDVIVAIEGPPVPKEDATIMIFEFLEKNYDTPPQRRNSPSPRREPRDDRSNISITVPDKLVARLIGRKGEQVKNMMDMSSCCITFHKTYEGVDTPEGDKARLCTLKGSTSSIASAVRIILENVNKLEQD